MPKNTPAIGTRSHFTSFAPILQPSVTVSVGTSFLLGVNAVDITPKREVHCHMAQRYAAKAGRTQIRIGNEKNQKCSMEADFCLIHIIAT